MNQHYQKHIFLCTNQKAPGKTCCANSGGTEYFDYLKTRLLELDMHGPGKIRISKSGCLGRCSLGPCIVIYPEQIWYTYSSTTDIDEIITSHLINNQLVKHLLLEN
ncbi:ferredoxin [Legionella dresdenensis]|uniref:Ferredoxin n=1 Tax=Legionella dresdenensis TaxID=450200 RepID=A0ABV8CEP7_9GAMM